MSTNLKCLWHKVVVINTNAFLERNQILPKKTNNGEFMQLRWTVVEILACAITASDGKGECLHLKRALLQCSTTKTVPKIQMNTQSSFKPGRVNSNNGCPAPHPQTRYGPRAISCPFWFNQKPRSSPLLSLPVTSGAPRKKVNMWQNGQIHYVKFLKGKRWMI